MIDRTRAEAEMEYVTFAVADQVFGIPANRVQSVLLPDAITEVPLASKDIAGLMNLRGHVIVVFDVRRQLGCAPIESDRRRMSIVVESGAEHVALLVDEVGDVLRIDAAKISPNPVSLSPKWATVCRGVYWLPERLLLIADIDSLIKMRVAIDE